MHNWKKNLLSLIDAEKYMRDKSKCSLKILKLGLSMVNLKHN
jgi:hypothetical protein